jgi:hypothetical protein
MEFGENRPQTFLQTCMQLLPPILRITNMATMRNFEVKTRKHEVA